MSSERRRPFLRAAVAVFSVAAPVVLLLALYLSPYFKRLFGIPVGSDVPQYLMRARLVEHGGTSALAGAFPYPFHANPDRPGFPVVASLLHAVTGITPGRLSFVWSAVLAVTVGLAAGALALSAIREPRWSLPVYVLAVGASVNLVLTAAGHVDNMMVNAVLMAAAAATLLAAAGRGSVIPPILLLGAAASIHWSFAAVFLALVVGLAAIELPAALRARRAGSGFSSTPSARLGVIAGGSAALGGVVFLLAPARPFVTGLRTSAIKWSLGRTIPEYGFPVVLPPAAVGAVALARSPEGERKRAFWLMTLWCGGAAVALLLVAAGVPVPGHRLLSFALAVPILLACGLVWAAGWIARKGRGRGRGRARVAAGLIAVVLAAGLGAVGWLAWRVVDGERPFISTFQLAQVRTLAHYIEGLPGSRDAVIVADAANEPLFGVAPAFRWTNAALPLDSDKRAFVYLGDYQDLLLRRPTLRQGEEPFNHASHAIWTGLRPKLRARPAIVELKGFADEYDQLLATHRAWKVAPGVLVIRGPRPSGGIPHVLLPTPPDPWKLVFRATVLLLALGVAGLGWARSLQPVGWLEAVALGPAYGIAALAILGFGADLVGLGLTGASGLGVAAGIAALGWLPPLFRHLTRHSADSAAAGRT